MEPNMACDMLHIELNKDFKRSFHTCIIYLVVYRPCRRVLARARQLGYLALMAEIILSLPVVNRLSLPQISKQYFVFFFILDKNIRKYW